MPAVKPFVGIKATVSEAWMSVTNFVVKNSGPQILKDKKKRDLVVNTTDYKCIGRSGGSPVIVEILDPVWSPSIPVKVHVRVAINGKYYWGEAVTEILLTEAKYQCKSCGVAPAARAYDCDSCGGRACIEEVI